ncbi:MAG: hypothetical protein AAGF11_38670 [Myxococcota bacterium]
MRRTTLWVTLVLVPPSCVGDPASGGATLSGGSGGGGGGGSGNGGSAPESSGVVDGSAGGPCQDGDEALESAWSAALSATQATAAALEQRTTTAIDQLAMVYGTNGDAATLAAEISADFAAHTLGGPMVSVSPEFCGDTLAATLAAADACNPGGAHAFAGCIGATQCADGCPGTAVGALENCSGECWGPCDLDAAGSCDGWCSGSCSGECQCTLETGECIGQCDGMCEGSCWLVESGDCNGPCMGLCQAIGAELDAAAWCLPEAGSVTCNGATTDCDERAVIDGLPPACEAVVGLAGAAAATCGAPELGFTVELAASPDDQAHAQFKQRLWLARAAMAELLAVDHHLELLLGQELPPVCDGSTGADLQQTHQQQRQALQQQRDALAPLLTALGS